MVIKTFKEGFTLVELSLSMIFIGVLSVAIVLIISDTISSYRRGLTLNQINTTGMDLVDDMRAALQNASSKSVLNDCYRFYDNDAPARSECLNDGGYGFVQHMKTGTVSLYDSTEPVGDKIPLYGVFCTGAYSYIWNTGYYSTEYSNLYEDEDKNWAKLQYTDSNGHTVTIQGSLSGYYNNEGSFSLNADKATIIGSEDKPFRLLKVPDRERAICASIARKSENGENADVYNKVDGTDENLGNVFVVDTEKYGSFASGLVNEPPVDLLLEDGDNDLAIYSLIISRPAESVSRKNSFYSASFILGTIRGGVNITAQGKNCKTPTEYEKEDFDYCAINNFSFAVQAGGE